MMSSRRRYGNALERWRTRGSFVGDDRGIDAAGLIRDNGGVRDDFSAI
jgi:hypothetical protein